MATSSSAAASVKGTDQIIVVKELRKRFGPQQVLDGVNLSCPTGEITTIVGPSGCGKTVLLKHLNLLLRPDSGSIIIDGTEVTRLSWREIDQVRNKFGMLFQGGALFDSMTVFENVAFPLVEKTNLSREEIEKRVNEKLRAVGLQGMGHKYPSEISGGMQKRVALARALIQEPKILMLDEPTTGLDPTRIGSIHALIRRTQQQLGLSAVLVSHDVPDVFEISDRVAFMNQGKIRLFGSVAEVMAADDELFKNFLAGKASQEDIADEAVA
jgi:phospholipid/cholesterol/gamma-HCH transport system ATP-binding protein